MTLSEIQDQINDFIVANGNNEITADVLRPILLGIVGQPNELIGDLSTLTTTEQSSLVAAINEINEALANAGGITIHTGADTPLVTPPGSYTTGDFYLQEVASIAVSFWQFNGTIWVEIKNVIDDATTAASTTWSSVKIQQAINERDGFITLEAIAYTDNSATIPAGAEWRIAGVTYTNPAEVILSIDPATAGYYRTDILVANTSNTFQIVEGTESTGTVAPAATPANTVKADEINIYGAAVVSTGPGGGFINVVGFFDYNDEATQTAPIAFSTGVPVKLTNDSLGPFTNLTERPYGVTTVWDPINNRFNFSQLTVGDTIDLRLDLDVTTAVANQSVKVYLKMGAGSPSEYDLPIWDTTYKSAAEHNVGRYTGLYIGSEDIRDYPAEIYLVSSDGSGTIKVNGWYPRIIRKGVNVYTLAVSDKDYVKKQFAGSYSYDVTGDNAVLGLQPEGFSGIALTNSSLNSVDGFNLDLITGTPGACVPYTGKPLKIFNFTGGDVSLTHDGAAAIPFLFRGAEDIILPAGEVIYLEYNIDGCVDTMRSWVDLNAVNLGEIIYNELAIKSTPSPDDEIVMYDSITGEAVTAKFSSFGGGSDIEDNMHKEWMSVQARYDLGGVFTLNMAVLVASGTQALVSRTGTSLYGSLSLQNYVTSTATGQNAGLKENNVSHGSIRQGFDAFFLFANNSTDNQHMTTVGFYSLTSAIPNLAISSFTGDFFGVGNDLGDTDLSFYAHRITASGQTASYTKVATSSAFPAHTTTDAYLLRIEAPQTEVEADRFVKMTLTNIITGDSVTHTFPYTETPVLSRPLLPVINRNNRNSGTATNIRFGKYNLVKKSY